MTLRTRLLAAIAYVLLLAIVAFGVPLASTLGARAYAEVRTQARGQADLVAATAADLLARSSRNELAVLVSTAAPSLRGRVLIVNAVGRVLVDSAGPATIGSTYRSRPEIASALAGRAVQVQRASATLGQEILATSVPIIHEGRPVGAVRVTQSVAAVQDTVRRVELVLAAIALTVLAVGLAAGAVLAAGIGRPLRRLEQIARRVAQGDLGARAKVEGSTEQRSLSSSFNEMTDRISRLLDAQRAFVADASHQLRTPLTGLRLRLDEASSLGAAQPALAAELAAAIEEVDRLSAIVDDLLRLSRADQRPADGAPVWLGDLAAAAARRWRREAAERGITLAAHHSGGNAVWADRGDLERALDALIENALRYSPAGAPVTIVDGPARIEVRDRGAGVDADERELVFERFHRGRAGRFGPAGHGLGLPIARELARGWGATVRLEPRAGGGTTAVLAFDSARTAAPVEEGAVTALPGLDQRRVRVRRR